MTNALTDAQREAVEKAILIANSVQHFRTAKHLREILATQHPDHSGDARFFVYSNDGGYNEYKTAAERADAYKAEIASYLDTMGDGWSEEVTTVGQRAQRPLFALVPKQQRRLSSAQRAVFGDGWL
jgi:hypothetical protein